MDTRESLKRRVKYLEEANTFLRKTQALNTYKVVTEGGKEILVEASSFTISSDRHRLNEGNRGDVVFFDARNDSFGDQIAYFSSPISIIKK